MLVLIVDFERVFDIVNRENMWEIMALYGIPLKYMIG